MRPRLLLCVLLTASTACAEIHAMLPAQPPPVRYRVGDYVLYRFTGNYTEAPVTLRKEVLARDGNRVTFDVTATRGSDSRHWTESMDMGQLDPKKANAEVYEYEGTEKKKVSNENNDALTRLYSWVSLASVDHATDVQRKEGQAEIAGATFTCMTQEGLIGWQHQTLKFRMYQCPDFVWNDGGMRFWNNRFGDNILHSEVVEFGNLHDTKPTAAKP